VSFSKLAGSNFSDSEIGSNSLYKTRVLPTLRTTLLYRVRKYLELGSGLSVRRSG
jgi:hypothetical protein